MDQLVYVEEFCFASFSCLLTIHIKNDIFRYFWLINNFSLIIFCSKINIDYYYLHRCYYRFVANATNLS